MSSTPPMTAARPLLTPQPLPLRFRRTDDRDRRDRLRRSHAIVCRAVHRCGPPMGSQILLIASSGGHLRELWQLRDLWPASRRHWVTFERPDALSLLASETVTWAAYPTNRNLPNLFRNLRIAVRLISGRGYQAIVTTGAGVAVPFALVGRLAGLRVVYIESIARVTRPSLTARLIYPLCTTFIVQWPALAPHFRRALYFGTVLDPS